LILAPLLAVFSLGSTNPMLGASRCVWGPSYWCANIQQASECSAVRHCVKAVWEKEEVPQDDDEVCKICKDMVGQARDTLLSNQTQEELKEVFDGSCDLIPLSIIAKECRVLADEFVPELVETLASEMNPDTVCTVSGLCNSERIDKMLAKSHKKEAHLGGDCMVCREGAAQTRAQIGRLTQDQVEDRLLELCGYMGSFSDACRLTVIQKAQRLYRTLTTVKWDDEICDLSGLCSQAFDSVPASPVSAGEDIQCEFCEKVIKHWVDVYANNASLAEFKQLLDGICDKLDHKNADHCKHIVDTYYIPAFEFLRHEVDPKMLCSLVGLCGPHRLEDLQEDVLTNQIVRQQAPLVPAIQTSSSSCDLCQFALTEVFTVLKDPEDQDMAKNVLESVCYRLPQKWEYGCEDFVERYTPMLLDFIANGLNPDEICSAMKLCSGWARLPSLPQQEVTVGDSKCVLCEYVVTTLDNLVSNKTNEEEIKEALESLCSYMPKSIVKQCDTFVDSYTEIIIDMLTKDVSPEMICSNLGLCDKQEVAIIIVEEPVRVGGAYCTLCDEVINGLEQQLKDKHNEDEIKEALDVFCYYLSTPVHKECIKMVSQYTEQLVDMIIHDFPPQKICAELGLCVDHSITSNAIPQDTDISLGQEMVPVEASEVTCEMCEFAISVIDMRLGDKATMDQIEREVQFVCSYLPGSIADKCEELVDQYGDKLIAALIKTEMDPKKVCTEVVPACKAQASCVWGPEMWCASPFHARVCGATELCKGSLGL